MIPSEPFFRWFPIVVATLQLVVLPLLIIALYYVIDARIDRHNANLYAHPALNDLKKLERKIEELSLAVNNLQLAIERLTPRRSTDRPQHNPE
jgi:hypothetical protein